MITHRMKIRRHLRSARVTALTSEERRQELREAERRNAQDGGRSEQAGAVPAVATGREAHDSAPKPPAV